MSLVTKGNSDGLLEPVNDPRWLSVVHRDASADGHFVYAVRTTGIYCRPSCPSRGAKRENVTFYAKCEEAETAGYRACRRCSPNAASMAEKNAAVIVEACRLIEAAEELPKLDDLAASVGMSPFYFHRQFKAITGLTPKAYGVAHRAQKVRQELATGSRVTDAIYEAGFNSNSRFYENSNQVLGMTPTVYKNGGRDADIRFAIGECSIGSVLVALSPQRRLRHPARGRSRRAGARSSGPFPTRQSHRR